jgi:hypothetical protein
MKPLFEVSRRTSEEAYLASGATLRARGKLVAGELRSPRRLLLEVVEPAASSWA